MQDIVTMSSKGQIVIPKRVRSEIGLEAGDQLQLEQNGNSLVFKKIEQEASASKASVVQELLGKYKTNDDEKVKSDSIRKWRESLYGKIDD